MEFGVLVDRHLASLHLRLLEGQYIFEMSNLFLGRICRGARGECWLNHQAKFKQLAYERLLLHQHRREGGHQWRGGEFADDRPVSLAWLDQTQGFERQDRFSQRAPADMKPFCQLTFGRKPVAGPKRTV